LYRILNQFSSFLFGKPNKMAHQRKLSGTIQPGLIWLDVAKKCFTEPREQAVFSDFCHRLLGRRVLFPVEIEGQAERNQEEAKDRFAGRAAEGGGN
jgi:hypothetical protein